MSNRTKTSDVPAASTVSSLEFAPVSVSNALTVDVEDYFHVEALSKVIDRADWANLPSRVEYNVHRLLELFDKQGATATFFILGLVAERHPQLVREITEAGHEAASHGWAHVRVDKQTPEEFHQDCARTKFLLEDLSGREVIGYRAATFSINANTTWAHRLLKETGHQYSSSVYPIRHDLYGMPEAPRYPFLPSGDDGVVELPITTLSLFGRKIPCGGGGYFRLMPYAVSRWAIQHINTAERKPCIFYMHPWEIDPDQPRQAGIGHKSRFRHYVNLHRMEGRLAQLLEQFDWNRMDEVFRSDICRFDRDPRDSRAVHS